MSRKLMSTDAGMTRRQFLRCAGVGAGLAVGSTMFSGVLTSCGGTTKGLKQASMRLLWLPQTQFAGYYVALDQGFYEEEGISLTVNPGGPNLFPTNLVATMADQFGHVDALAVTSARDQGLPLKVIFNEDQYDQTLLVAHADSGITRPKDFEGKKVAMWFGTMQYQMRAAVALDGGDPNLVIEVPQGGDFGPFISREWDLCAAMSYNELITLRDEMQIPLNEIWYKDWGVGFPKQGVSCADRLLEEDPDLVEGFVKATIRGWKWAIDNQEASLDSVLKRGSELPREHQRKMLTEMIRCITGGPAATYGIGYLDPQSMQDVVSFMTEFELINAPVNAEDIYDPNPWNEVPDSIKKV